MATPRKLGFSILTCTLVLLTFCAKFCQSDSPTCAKWASLARTMTGNLQGTCVSNATSVCTRYDCEGIINERVISQLITVDYCFGIQLNSCLEPLSVDFYLNVPSQNFSLMHRVTHDQIIYLSDIGIPELETLPVKPLLDFELEKDGSDSVLVSVTFKVKSALLPIYFDKFETSIIDEEELPLMPCKGPLIQDTVGKPADNFMSVPCHAKKYSPSQPKVITPTTNVKPSETFNKTCDFTHGCSQGEMCQMKTTTEGTCDCEPDYLYVSNLEVCISQGRVGLECQSDGDCGSYEECGKGVTKSICQCEESFKWDGHRRLCILASSKHHSHSDEDDHQHHTPSVDTTTTTTTEKPSNHTGDDANTGKQNTASANTKYIIIAAAAVGGVVLIAGVVAGLLLCRRRRQTRFAASGGGLYDSADTPMLVDNDDVDLVM